MAGRKYKNITAFFSEEEIKELQQKEISFLKEGIRLRLELVNKIFELINDKSKKVTVSELAQAIKLLNTELRNTIKDLGNLEKVLGKSRNETEDEVIDEELKDMLEKANQLEEQIQKFTI